MTGISRYHVIITVKGQRSEIMRVELTKKIVVLHRVLASLDADWPYVKPKMVQGRMVGAGPETGRKVCVKCGGLVYACPFLTPGQVKKIGKKIGVKVKVVRWEKEEKCAGVLGIVAAMREVVAGTEGWRVVGGTWGTSHKETLAAAGIVSHTPYRAPTDAEVVEAVRRAEVERMARADYEAAGGVFHD